MMPNLVRADALQAALAGAAQQGVRQLETLVARPALNGNNVGACESTSLEGERVAKIVGILVASFFVASLAHAFGISYAVNSFEKAKAAQSQDKTKHILVVYTVPSN